MIYYTKVGPSIGEVEPIFIPQGHWFIIIRRMEYVLCLNTHPHAYILALHWQNCVAPIKAIAINISSFCKNPPKKVSKLLW